MTNDSSRPIAISFQEYRDEEIVEFFANENRTFHPENAGANFGRHRLVGAPHFTTKSKSTATAAFRGSDQKKSSRKEEDVIPTSPEILAEILESAPDVLAATIHEPPKRKKDIRSEPTFNKPTRPLASVLGGRSEKPRQAASVLNDPLAREEELKKNPLPTHNRPILIARLQDAILPMPNVSKHPEPPEVQAETEEVAAVETDEKPDILSLEERLLARLQETDQQLGRLIESWPRLSDRLKETISALVDVAENDEEKEETPTSAPIG